MSSVGNFLAGLLGGERTIPERYLINEDAPGVSAAMAEARRTLPAFWRAYEDPEIRSSCMVKLHLAGASGEKEPVWVSDITRGPDGDRGLIANEPESLAPLVYCSEVMIDPDQIADWQYVKDDKVWGAFTDRAMFLNLAEGRAAGLPPMFSPTPVEEGR